MLRRRQPAPQPDPRLDSYRRAAARLYDGEAFAGHLLTRVNVWWTTQGPWWRARDVDPQERVECLLDFERTFDLAPSDGWADGVDADPTDFDKGCFVYRGRRLHVVWLDGQEAEEQFTLHDWARHD